MNALIMFDRETNSLWSHFLSEGIEGKFEGTKLTNIPTVLTTWKEWKSSFPETRALLKTSRGYDPYSGYYERDDSGVIGEANRDDRLHGKELVLGLGFDDGAIAFPHTALLEEVINIEINGEPLVVYYDSHTTTALAYSRILGDDILVFSLLTEDDTNGFIKKWIVDDKTGSKWLPLNGQAWEGELQGARLAPVHAVNVFWFAWSDFYPDTEIYGQ